MIRNLISLVKYILIIICLIDICIRYCQVKFAPKKWEVSGISLLIWCILLLTYFVEFPRTIFFLVTASMGTMIAVSKLEVVYYHSEKFITDSKELSILEIEGSRNYIVKIYNRLRYRLTILYLILITMSFGRYYFISNPELHSEYSRLFHINSTNLLITFVNQLLRFVSMFINWFECGLQFYFVKPDIIRLTDVRSLQFFSGFIYAGTIIADIYTALLKPLKFKE